MEQGSANNKATLTVSGAAIISGMPSEALSLQVGGNTCEIKVTAEDVNATVYINDIFCARGSTIALHALNLSEMDFHITIRVVAEDDTEMIYYGVICYSQF